MLTNERIAHRFWNDPNLRQSVILDIGKFTVAMFALGKGLDAKGCCAGTGTLLALNGEHYILSASHVWHEHLKSSSKIGLSLIAEMTHSYKMETGAVELVSDLRPIEWNEWGPDLMLLRIPCEYVSEISAHKIFYDEKVDGKPVPENCGGVDLRLLVGTPAELGTFEPLHADLAICNFFVDVNAPFKAHNGYDFVDFNFNVNAPGNPKNYGGVSRGGLWDLTLYFFPETDNQLDWSRTLKGVAFWQLPIVDSHRTVRCHGPESLDVLKRQIKD